MLKNIERLLKRTEKCSYGLTTTFLGLKPYKRYWKNGVYQRLNILNIMVKKHSVVLLICLILWEMICSRIGKENIKYIDEEEIGKYVDNIMEDYLPKKWHNFNNEILLKICILNYLKEY